MTSVSHIAGPPITMTSVSRGLLQRQRCLWCGALILELELESICVQLPPDGSPPKPPATWTPGGIVRLSGTNPKVSELIEIGDEDLLPDDHCGNIDFAVTQ